MAGAEGTNGSGSRSSGTGRSGSRRRRTRARTTRTGEGGAARGELLPEGKLYYRIGEVAKITDVKPHVLRYWETEFRWMAPPKSRARQRLYRRKDIEMILAIKRLLYEERYTIAGARQRLRDLGLAKALETVAESGPPESAPEDGGTEDTPARAVAELRQGYRRIRRELQALRKTLA